MKLQMEGIGDILFLRNARSKNLRITVKPFEGVKVTLPYNISYKTAINFVSIKKDWIKNSIDKMQDLENKAFTIDEQTSFRTKYHVLKIFPYNKKTFKGFTKSGVFYFYYPDTMDVTSKDVQNHIKTGITWLLRKEAKAFLPFRVAHLAEKYGFSYNRVFVKNIKTRWGSCSGKNNINLNIHLMRLPDHLIDYVILHELVHTLHRNHSRSFWNALDKLCGDSHRLRKEMRSYSIML